MRKNCANSFLSNISVLQPNQLSVYWQFSSDRSHRSMCPVSVCGCGCGQMRLWATFWCLRLQCVLAHACFFVFRFRFCTMSCSVRAQRYPHRRMFVKSGEKEVIKSATSLCWTLEVPPHTLCHLALCASQSVRAVTAWADQRQVGGLVFFQQSRDFLVVRIWVQWFVVLIVVLVVRALFHLLRLGVMLLLSRGHFCCVSLPPFSSSVLKPNLLCGGREKAELLNRFKQKHSLLGINAEINNTTMNHPYLHLTLGHS